MDETNKVALIVAAGGVGSLLVILLTLDRHKKLVGMANRVLELALAGRTQEARAQARQGSRDILPLVDALGGALVRPEPARSTGDVLALFGLLGPWLLLAAYGMLALADDGKRSAIVAALLLGVAALLPVSLASALIVVSLGRHAAHRVRASSVAVLAKNVKSAVEAEVAEAMRRTAAPRDPRGD